MIFDENDHHGTCLAWLTLILRPEFYYTETRTPTHDMSIASRASLGLRNARCVLSTVLSTVGRRLRSLIAKRNDEASPSGAILVPSPGRPRCSCAARRAPCQPRAQLPQLPYSLSPRLTWCLTHASHVSEVVLWESDHPSTNAWCWRDGAGPERPLALVAARLDPTW